MIPHNEFLGEVAEASRPLAVPERTRQVMHKDYPVDLNNEQPKNRTDFSKRVEKLDKEEWNADKFHEGLNVVELGVKE